MSIRIRSHNRAGDPELGLGSVLVGQISGMYGVGGTCRLLASSWPSGEPTGTDSTTCSGRTGRVHTSNCSLALQDCFGLTARSHHLVGNASPQPVDARAKRAERSKRTHRVRRRRIHDDVLRRRAALRESRRIEKKCCAKTPRS